MSGHLGPVVPEITASEKRYGRVGSPTKSSSMFVNELSPFNSDRKNSLIGQKGMKKCLQKVKFNAAKKFAAKMSCSENSGDEISSGKTGRGENLSCAEI